MKVVPHLRKQAGTVTTPDGSGGDVSKRTCPLCGGPKAYYAQKCMACHAESRRGRTCEFPGCTEPYHSNGFCTLHHSRWKRGGSMHGDGRARRNQSIRGKEQCVAEDESGRCAYMVFNVTLRLCAMHDDRRKRWGDVGPVARIRRPAGEWRTNAQGYVERGGRKNSKILEHVVEMERLLGRRLRPHETVHHVNQVRDDNRPENLELCCSVTKTGLRQPGARVEDLVAFVCKEYPEFVAAYMAGDSQLRLVS